MRELFQLDQADLDFGLYRIFHIKRVEVEAFLTQQLPDEIDRAFSAAAGAERSDRQRKVDELAERARSSVDDDAILPSGEPNPAHAAAKAVKEYAAARRRLLDVEAAEGQRSDVFNFLYAFFSRYYDAGDFIPRRAYRSSAPYAVPYNGEEVVFHWANKGQYYVKSGEAFRNYAFTLATVTGTYEVQFRVVEATVPKDNTKGKSRFFFPVTDGVEFDSESLTLTIPFHYRLPSEAEAGRYGTGAKAQEVILDEIEPEIRKAVKETALRAGLSESRASGAPSEGEETPTLLSARLRHFAKKTTTDYFVHKDLGSFFRRELDFFIRDQIVHEADLGGDLEAKRRAVRVFRTVAETVITFLAEIEDAQRRLFEKKKFVLSATYLAPVSNVPKALWPEILANRAQIAEWEKLFAIPSQLDRSGTGAAPDEHTLDEHPTLVVNTALFDESFTRRLLAQYDDIDAETMGLLIWADNFQALRLLNVRYYDQVSCIYIDPPYNTGDSEILYKNGYLFSSWLALMENRITAASGLLADNSVMFIAIDDFEMVDLCALIDTHFPNLRREMVVVNHHPQGGKATTLASTHEYMLVCVDRKSDMTLSGRAIDDGTELRRFTRSGTAESNFRARRPNSFYALLVRPDTLEVVGAEPPPVGTYPTGEAGGGLVRIYPLGRKKEERVWRRAYESGLRLIREGKLLCSKNMTILQRIEAGERTPALFSNWIGPRYNAGTFGANLLSDIIGSHNPFPYPKSLNTVADAIFAADLDEEAICLDFFAGSGTTGHAVMALNREDGFTRRFILVEQGEYFKDVLLPRVQKVMFAPEWKAGRPSRHATKAEAERTPRLVKVLRLESYEDALHNTFSPQAIERLERREEAYQKTVGREQFRIRYLVKLPVEASGSMVDLAKLEHPFDYTLDVLTDHGPRAEAVDLVETFNWLYGLRVRRVLTLVNAKDKVGREKSGRSYRAVAGSDREGRKRVLVVWRDMTGLEPAVERSFLERAAAKLGTFDEYWINGDTVATGFSSLDGLFKTLMQGDER